MRFGWERSAPMCDRWCHCTGASWLPRGTDPVGRTGIVVLGQPKKAQSGQILTDGFANGAHLKGGAIEGLDGTGSSSSQRFLDGRR